MNSGIYGEQNSSGLLDEYRENSGDEGNQSDMQRLKKELPESTFERIEGLVDDYDDASEILEQDNLEELSLIELKFVVGSYLGRPADYVVEKISLEEQFQFLVSRLHKEIGGVEL